jgi:hypothetical protein
MAVLPSRDVLHRQGRAEAIILLWDKGIITTPYLITTAKLIDVENVDILIAADRAAKQRKISKRPFSWDYYKDLGRTYPAQNTEKERWCGRCGFYLPLFDEVGDLNFYKFSRESKYEFSVLCKRHSREEMRESARKRKLKKNSEKAKR